MKRTVLLIGHDPAVHARLRAGLEDTGVPVEGTQSDKESILRRLCMRDAAVVTLDLDATTPEPFGLLAALLTYYPEIPVVAETRRDCSSLKDIFQASGVTLYERGTELEILTREIRGILQNQVGGGVLYGVSPSVFLQLVEMEERSCTIRVQNDADEARGVFFFLEGRLVDARYQGLEGRDAALVMFGWESITLAIQEGAGLTEDRVQSDLQALLLDAARISDEGESGAQPSGGGVPGLAEARAGVELPDRVARLRDAWNEAGAPPVVAPVSGTDSGSAGGVFRKLLWNLRDLFSEMHGAVGGAARLAIKSGIVLLVLCFALSVYLWLTMETPQEAQQRVDAVRKALQSEHAALQKVAEEIASVQAALKEAEQREGDRKADVTRMDLNVTYYNLFEKKEAVQFEIERREAMMAKALDRLERIRQYSIFQRMVCGEGRVRAWIRALYPGRSPCGPNPEPQEVSP